MICMKYHTFSNDFFFSLLRLGHKPPTRGYGSCPVQQVPVPRWGLGQGSSREVERTCGYRPICTIHGQTPKDFCVHGNIPEYMYVYMFICLRIERTPAQHMYTFVNAHTCSLHRYKYKDVYPQKDAQMYCSRCREF